MLTNLIFLSILFGQMLSQDTRVEERKKNHVVNILDKVLKDVNRELTTKNISIPYLDLKQHGKFENVTVSISKMTNRTDGVGSFGFLMNLNVSEILVAGYYEVKDIDVPDLFPITGKGRFTVSVDAVNVNLKIQAINDIENNRFNFNISVFDVSVMNSKLGFENLMEEPHVSDFLNELLGKLIPNLVKAFLPSLSKLLHPLLDFYGNGIIVCIKTQILDLENCIKNLFVCFTDDFLNRLM